MATRVAHSLGGKQAGAVARDSGKPEDDGWRPFTRDIALRGFSEPADVAGVVSFLAGPDSDYLTRQSIIVDGGTVLNCVVDHQARD